MKRILFVATVASHIKAFHLPFINLLEEKGYEVEVACYPDTPLNGLHYVWAVPFSRSPYSKGNMAAFKTIKKLLQERCYDLIHVHTPVAAFLVRLAARNMNVPVLYTVHGFHFYKGAPLKNHLIYGTMERLAARWTAGLIAINREDLEAARRLGFIEGRNLFFVRGVGVDLDYYGPDNTDNTRDNKIDIGFEICPGSPIVLCVGEFTPNKNQALLIDAWKYVIAEVPRAKLLFAGQGECEGQLKERVSGNGLSGSVHFLGYRTDIPKLLSLANVVTQVSKREGLPRSIMEAMAAGKPTVATSVRGNCDLVRDGVNGFLVPLGDPKSLAKALIRLLVDKDLAQRMGMAGREMIQEYSLDRILQEMWDIYQRYL
ncbi:MAG TPA: glycosyltransferase family 4 protein [Firmicutes bacterium]|nr:glycosyltransferase family 4 protein [Bacillota bacterium]